MIKRKKVSKGNTYRITQKKYISKLASIKDVEERKKYFSKNPKLLNSPEQLIDLGSVIYYVTGRVNLFDNYQLKNDLFIGGGDFKSTSELNDAGRVGLALVRPKTEFLYQKSAPDKFVLDCIYFGDTFKEVKIVSK